MFLLENIIAGIDKTFCLVQCAACYRRQALCIEPCVFHHLPDFVRHLEKRALLDIDLTFAVAFSAVDGIAFARRANDRQWLGGGRQVLAL